MPHRIYLAEISIPYHNILKSHLLRNESVYLLPGLSLEKAMAPHSCTLAWKIPWMEEPGRLQSVGSLRVGHD